MSENSYKEILEQDADQSHFCSFNWDCDNCYKRLCLRVVGVASFPSIYGCFELVAFTNNKDKKDHVILVKGDVVHGENLLIRLHSSCLTGDVLGSLRCDCGPQLRQSFSMIEEEGLGAILYMQQEGRGIGLTNKIKSYMLQDNGVDTYDANVYLGFQPDERQYELAAAMLKKLDVHSIRLMTNNPQKIEELTKYGVKINARVPIEIPANAFNLHYLQTKKNRFGHLLSLD